ncbi:unnamed protein product [Closterium sp. NIES-54]
MMEKFFSFMSFYEQHQQAAHAQSNNSDNNNRATPMSLDGSSYARGNQQQPTFAPYEPHRGSINFAPHQQSSPGQEKTLDALQKLRQIDDANAFLYAPVDAKIFVEHPHGSNEDPNQVCQLQKSLYGIKQAPRLWQQHLHARLVRIGFCQLPHDQGMYRLTKGTNYILLIVYVDDLLYIGSTDDITTWFEGELQQDLTLTVATTVTQYLGLNIQDGDNTIYLSAKKYTDTIAKRFGLTLATITTPYRYTDGNRKVSALLKPTGIRDYQRKLGCLLFASVTCRPDLSYLYLLSVSKDSVSLFYLPSGAATAPPATADSSTRSQWLTRDVAARLDICNHLPLAECAHFGQHRTAQALYDAVVARFSSPATAALGRLLLPYLFPELSAFAIIEDLVSHLRASDARYRAAVPAEFLDRNPPPMYINLYFIVTRFPDSLRSVRDHFLSLDPTSLTIDLLEQHLLVAETNAVAVGAACGTPRPPFFEGCSPSPLAPSYASDAAADVSVPEDVGAACANAKRRSSKGKGGRGGGGGGIGGGGGGSGSGGGGSSGGGGGGGSGGWSGGSAGSGGGSGGSGGSGGGGTGGGGTGARRVSSGGGQRQQQQRRSETLSPQQLREWFLRGPSGGSYPIDIFDLDFDAILFAMYALSVSAEGECYRCVPPDPGIAAAALGASESGTLPGTAPAEALHTFTLDAGASRCFFRDSTTLTPLPAPVPVGLADPSGGPVVARSSTVLPYPAVPPGSLSGLHLPLFSTNLVSTAALQDAMVTTTTPGGQRVSICTCTRTRRHLATFTRWPGSSLYTLATEPSHVAASAQVYASGQVAASCSCCLLSHQTLLWHHHLGNPSLPRLRGMHSRLLVSGLPRSVPPLPPSPTPPCLPCVQGRQRAAPHSSSFPPTTAPMQTLHMDVWGPARVSGQGRERYFLLVVDDYTRYTTVFPLRSKGQVVDVLIPWIGTARLQLRERFGQDLHVMRLHSDRGGEFSSNLLRDFCRGEGIFQSFMLPNSPQQNGIAERRIGSMRSLLNLLPRVSLPETSLTLRWTGEVGDASLFRGPAPSGVSKVDPLPGPAPVQVVVGSGAARGAASAGAESGGAKPGGVGSEGAETGGAEPGGVGTGGAEPGGAASEGAESGVAEPQGAASSGGSAGALPRLSPQQLREWFVRRARFRSGATGAGGAGAAGAGGAGVAAGPSGAGGATASGPRGARTRGTGAAGTGGVEGAGVVGPGAGGAGAAGAGVGGTGAGGIGVFYPCAGGARGTVRPRPYFVPLLQKVIVTPSSTGLTPPLLCPTPDQSHPPLQPASPLPAPSPYTEQFRGLTKHREPASRPVLPRVHLPATPESSLPEVPDPESDRARAVSPVVSCLLATDVTDPSFESAAASALVAELLDFAAACRLDYATALVAESASASPPSVGAECALRTNVLEDRQEYFECLAATVPRFTSMLLALEGDPDAPDIPTPRSYAEAITGPYSSQGQAAMDAEMASWKSTGTYVDEVPPPGANIVDGMWIFRVKRPPGSPPAFKARYVARGFSQRQGVDYFHTFSPTPKMTTLRVLLHVVAQRDYELHSLDFSTAFLQGSLHEEIKLCRPPGFTGTFPARTQRSLRRPVYGLRQAPREWHDTLSTTLAALGFAPSTTDPSLFLRTDTSLPPFYVLVYVDELVFATAVTKTLTLVKSELQKRHTCTDLGELRSYLGLQITRDRARRTITLTQSHMVHQVLQRFGFQFSSPQPTPLSTSHSLSAPPSDESVEPSGPYPELVGCLMYLMTCTRPDLAYPLSLLARYVAPGRQRKVHWDAAKRVLRYLCSTSGMGLVLGGRGPVVLTGHADASWELRWVTYLLTDLGEQPRSPPVLHVDNKAMIALC